jgi:hypothetical protein
VSGVSDQLRDPVANVVSVGVRLLAERDGRVDSVVLVEEAGGAQPLCRWRCSGPSPRSPRPEVRGER